MPDDQNTPVGYKSPPVHSRFRKGGPQPARKRKAVEAIDLHQFFSEPIKVRRGDREVKMPLQEVALLKMGQKAIGGDMRYAAAFIKECARANLFIHPDIGCPHPSILYVPKDYDSEEWHANFQKFGFPPWPFLEHDGVTQHQDIDDATPSG